MNTDSEIAISITKHMAGTDAAPFLSYRRRSESLNALLISLYSRTDLLVVTMSVRLQTVTTRFV
jgi:hypothetical protein